MSTPLSLPLRWAPVDVDQLADNAFVRFLRRVNRAIEQRRRYRMTVEQLHRLSERDLEDIGISRSHIDEVARELAFGSPKHKSA